MSQGAAVAGVGDRGGACERGCPPGALSRRLQGAHWPVCGQSQVPCARPVHVVRKLALQQHACRALAARASPRVSCGAELLSLVFNRMMPRAPSERVSKVGELTNV
mmetsp:Transcript_7127/g.19377  ORF Transcript_7127/g.19377 Transcript_7127/m.19377 type:complete len:106 (+) Transcript_7127:1416-1733(+)